MSNDFTSDDLAYIEKQYGEGALQVAVDFAAAKSQLDAEATAAVDRYISMIFTAHRVAIGTALVEQDAKYKQHIDDLMQQVETEVEKLTSYANRSFENYTVSYASSVAQWMLKQGIPHYLVIAILTGFDATAKAYVKEQEGKQT